jgi:NACHT domain
MNGRYQEISQISGNTFEWIYDDQSIEDGYSSQGKFKTWLMSGNGIFSIIGKPGCGKSTLMKFLYKHHRTKELLEVWADGKELIIASFFFQQSGTMMQKSINGLIRSLLYTCLRQHPDLISEAFPNQWRSIENTSIPNHATIYFNHSELLGAFQYFIESPDFHRKHCLCFFIDGLDEFQESSGMNYEDLVKLFKCWTDYEPEYIKLCVSSRQTRVSVDNFSSSQSLRMHDLTERDIQTLVQQTLMHSTAFAEEFSELQQEQLVNCIVKHADGMFLWASLTTKSLVDGLNNGDHFFDLLHKLDAIPNNLEDMYQISFNSIHPKDHQAIFGMLKVLFALVNSF